MSQNIPWNVFILREIIRLFVRLIYRIEIVGHENVPNDGPVLFVSNHISYADPVLISASTPQHIRFLVWRAIFNWKPTTWFFKLMGGIPIDPLDSPREMLRSLAEARQALLDGDRVGLFAEGEISRSGVIQRFRKGLEYITRGTEAKIVPINIHGMWGSIFSYEGGKFFWKWPKKIPYPVTVLFGAPMPPNTPAEDVQKAVTELVTFSNKLS